MPPRTKKVEAPEIDPRLEFVRTDINGNNFYTFKSAPETPWRRFMAGNIADFFLKKGMPDSYMRKVITVGKDLCFDTSRTEKQRLQDMHILWQNMEGRLNYVCSEEQYLRFASIYFVLADEPLKVIHESYTQKKFQMWNEDEESKDFFLQWAFSRTMESVDISLEDIKSYLTIAKEREMSLPTLPAV